MKHKVFLMSIVFTVACVRLSFDRSVVVTAKSEIWPNQTESLRIVFFTCNISSLVMVAFFAKLDL